MHHAIPERLAFCMQETSVAYPQDPQKPGFGEPYLRRSFACLPLSSHPESGTLAKSRGFNCDFGDLPVFLFENEIRIKQFIKC
jgi:hypothetical protein